MQIRELPRGGQLGFKGNVINVPSDVNLTVKALPRNMNDSETIPVKFKRRLSYKSHLVYEQIRPERVLKAAKWLVENSSLFQSEGIYVKENWSTDDGSRNAETHACVDDIIQGVGEDIISSSSDDWSEDDQYNNQHWGNLDTVMQPADFR